MGPTIQRKGDRFLGVVSVVPSANEAVLTVLSKLNRKVGDGGPLKGVAGPVSRFKARRKTGVSEST